MERSIDDYRAMLLVDQNKLDSALEQQPMLYQEVATQAVYAMSRAEQVKDLLKRKDNELSLSIRAAKDSAGVKYTEAVIIAETLLDGERIALAEESLTAARVAGEWQALKDSFHQRSYVLKDLAALFIAGYYASDTVRAPSASRAEADLAANRAAIQAQRIANRTSVPAAVAAKLTTATKTAAPVGINRPQLST